MGRNWQQVTALGGSVLSLVATQPTGNQARVILCATDQGLYRGLDQAGYTSQNSPVRIPKPHTHCVRIELLPIATRRHILRNENSSIGILIRQIGAGSISSSPEVRESY